MSEYFIKAVEHGRYLADAAERLQNAINVCHRVSVECDKDRDEEIVNAADEESREAWRGLSSAIYEFRKRAKACNLEAPKS